MRAGPDLDVLVPESGDLTVTEAILYRDEQQGPIAPSNPGGEIGSGHQGPAFVLREELDGVAFMALRRHGQDSLTLQTEARFTDGDVPEEGA